MKDSKRIEQLEKAILEAIGKVPDWAPAYDTYCPFCVGAPRHFAHCITKTINDETKDAQDESTK
jgi:hypothetical protein